MVRSTNPPRSSSAAAASSAAASGFNPFAVDKMPFHKKEASAAAPARRTLAKSVKMTPRERVDSLFEVNLKRDHKCRRLLNRGDAFKKPGTKVVVKKDAEGNDVNKTIPWGRPALRKSPWKACLMDIIKRHNGGNAVRISPALQEQIGNDVLTTCIARDVLPDAQQRRVDAAPHPTREDMAKHFLVDVISARHLESAVRWNLTHAQKVNPGLVGLGVFNETLAALTEETEKKKAADKEKAAEKARITELIADLQPKWAKLVSGRITDKDEKERLYAAMKELSSLRVSRVGWDLAQLDTKLTKLKDAAKELTKTTIPEAKKRAAELDKRSLDASPPDADAPAEEKLTWDDEMAILARDLPKAKTFVVNRLKELDDYNERIAKLEEKIADKEKNLESLRKEGKNATTHLRKLHKQEEEEEAAPMDEAEE